MTSPSSDLLATLRGGRMVISVIGVVLVVTLLGRALTAAYVEILWQSQAGYFDAFLTRIIWEWGVRVGAGLFVAAVVYFNLRITSTTLGGIQIRRRFGNLEISEQIPPRYVTWAILAASMFLGLWFGASVSAGTGRAVLLAVSAESWGVAEPVLGRDLGYYVFWWPVLARIVTYALVVTFLAFTLATGGYSATGALAWVRGKLNVQAVARIHLGAILATFFVLLALRLWIGRYELLMNGNSAVQGIFGFADAQARLPALQTLTVLSLGAAAGTLWGAVKNRPWPILGSFAAVVLGSVLIGNAYPSLVQSFRVEPNELERETRYIQYSLDFTRRGYGLHEEAMERRALDFDGQAPIDWELASEQLSGLPVWGSRALLTAYEELEALYPYYDFERVAIDRYPSESGLAPVAVSVREVNPGNIPERNWQNVHLREIYIAGRGAVASLASHPSPAARPELLLRGIPPTPTPAALARGSALTLERPEIYFGVAPQEPYAIATPGTDQFSAPDGTLGVAGVDFPEGIALSSALRKALLAWRFAEVNLIFSSELTAESRLIHRRRVLERAAAIAPFLRFPEDAYPVIAGGRVVWILEGFTATLAYPLSAAYELGSVRRPVSYVRNSVKVTVDAVTGDIDFYRVPVDDPIADAYEVAYPGLIKPIAEMPSQLREHLRYPRVLLDVQSRVLLQYHQESAPAFHGQQDVWMTPQELAVNMNEVPYEAEYGIYRLPGEEPRFQLSTVFVPLGRQNLTAMLVARTDDRGIPETILLDIPVSDEVLGPAQVEAFLEQEPDISEQFSLWRTGGSQVWTGHLHLVPVGNRLVYMEPVFLAAEGDAIPELRRFVVSDGDQVVWGGTLAEAIGQLSGRIPAGTRSEVRDSAPERATGLDTARWPAEALDLLGRAEDRARQGDWQGYGEALAELRALLERLGGGGA